MAGEAVENNRKMITALNEGRKMRCRDLAKVLGIDFHTCRKRLKRLQADGYVARDGVLYYAVV